MVEVPIALRTVYEQSLRPQTEAKKGKNNATQQHHPEKGQVTIGFLVPQLRFAKMSEVYVCFIDIIAWPFKHIENIFNRSQQRMMASSEIATTTGEWLFLQTVVEVRVLAHEASQSLVNGSKMVLS